jgi:hypothetical protein
MRTRLIAILGAIGSFGLLLLHFAKWIADVFAIIHLPHDLEGALIKMAETPMVITFGIFVFGSICASYVVLSFFKPSFRLKSSIIILVGLLSSVCFFYVNSLSDETSFPLPAPSSYPPSQGATTLVTNTPQGILLSIDERTEYKRKGSTVYMMRGREIEIKDWFQPNPDDSTYHQIILRVTNELPKGLSNITLMLTKADGPIGLEYVENPRKISVDEHLNPQDFRDIVIAGYQENPPSNRLCLEIASGYPCGLWSAKTKVEYTFVATASESLRAIVKVKIWVENNKLLFQVI